MAKKKHANKKIWLVIVEKYTFIIIANTEKECKELIDELSEGTITADIDYNPIGNMCPTFPSFKHWEGESFIISTNFYDI